MLCKASPRILTDIFHVKSSKIRYGKKPSYKIDRNGGGQATAARFWKLAVSVSHFIKNSTWADKDDDTNINKNTFSTPEGIPATLESS